MAGFVTTLRTARATAINTAIGGSGKLRIYSGLRPATGAAETTMLVELPCASGAFGAVVSGVLTAGTITPTAASVGGTASWARVLTSANVPVMDLSVGVGGGFEVNLSTTNVVSGGTVTVSSCVITEGNV
jgi:hypothetical protein